MNLQKIHQAGATQDFLKTKAKKMSSPQKKLGFKGFTLLEVLVVLTLTSLIFGSMISFVSKVYDIRLRFRDIIDTLEESFFGPLWFQKTIEGIFMTKDKLEGDDKHFKAVTIAPLFDDIGVVAPFEWWIEADSESENSLLVYQGPNEKRLVVSHLKGRKLYFEYFDNERNEWLKDWQKGGFVSEEEYKLPRYIRIQGTENPKEVFFASLEHTRPYMKIAASKAQRTGEDSSTERDKKKSVTGFGKGDGEESSDRLKSDFSFKSEKKSSSDFNDDSSSRKDKSDD
jgi:prepilin-type N-terminal cleavage/methylation domain-containing protein